MMQKCLLVPSLGLIKVTLQDEKAIRNLKTPLSLLHWCVMEWKIMVVP